jgi:hypothetical protein
VLVNDSVIDIVCTGSALLATVGVSFSQGEPFSNVVLQSDPAKLCCLFSTGQRGDTWAYNSLILCVVIITLHAALNTSVR